MFYSYTECTIVTLVAPDTAAQPGTAGNTDNKGKFSYFK